MLDNQSYLSSARLMKTLFSALLSSSFLLVNMMVVNAQELPGQGWYRLQLKSNNQYLDAKYCSAELSLNPGPGYNNGICQLWRLVPNGDGWYRLQLKSNNQYLDAKYCSAELSLNPGPGYNNGICQLWRLVPDSVPIDGGTRLNPVEPD